MTEDIEPFTPEELAELRAMAAERKRTGESYLSQLLSEYEMRKLRKGHPDLPGWWRTFLRAWKPDHQAN